MHQCAFIECLVCVRDGFRCWQWTGKQEDEIPSCMEFHCSCRDRERSRKQIKNFNLVTGAAINKRKLVVVRRKMYSGGTFRLVKLEKVVFGLVL